MSTEEREPQRDPRAEPEQVSRWRRPLVVAVVLAAAAVAIVQLAWDPEKEDSTPSGSASATLPAWVDEIEAHVVELLSYTPRDVGKRLDVEGAYLTGDFAEAFGELTRGVIAPDAAKHQVTVKAKAVDSGLSSLTDGEAELLVFVETTTTSARLSEPRIDGARLRVLVTQVDDEWLINELDPV